ncbi:FecR family protein [Dyadobacter psychrotolerans]|uniref:DUF4974 domain-containing protein n=1 Tax=Dyadobacter psychrotolerans TaxID=2541721 RepID=A0A4R5DKY2_9BACT|nr:FecR domain-containing protein [Dyadobacter psychrotolerans]TDE14862.1 DUF4974 domain-containing protein [Dyadobacter psychrotolerans]
MKYRHFTVEDFLADNFFQQWILAPDEQNDSFWKHWIQQNPDRHQVIAQAIELAGSFEFTEKWSDQERSAIWANIENGVNHPRVAKHSLLRSLHWKSWLSAASLLLVLSTIAVIIKQNDLHQIATSFGQIKKITLSDGSLITLNANSRLSYAENSFDQKREIWVEGEAFFEVSKKMVDGKKVPFIVHANDLSIQVLGTAFNVANRRGAVNVALAHGAVKVVDTYNKANTVVLKPGESVSQSGAKNPLYKQKVDVAQYASWKNKVIIFRRKSLKELSEMMKDLYDIEVIIDNTALQDQRFTGSFPSDSSQILFDKLKKMYPLQVVKIGTGYHIR